MEGATSIKKLLNPNNSISLEQQFGNDTNMTICELIKRKNYRMQQFQKQIQRKFRRLEESEDERKIPGK